MADFCLVSNDKIGTRKIINSTQYLRNDVDIEVQTGDLLGPTEV